MEQGESVITRGRCVIVTSKTTRWTWFELAKCKFFTHTPEKNKHIFLRITGVPRFDPWSVEWYCPVDPSNWTSYKILRFYENDMFYEPMKVSPSSFPIIVLVDPKREKPFRLCVRFLQINIYGESMRVRKGKNDRYEYLTTIKKKLNLSNWMGRSHSVWCVSIVFLAKNIMN